MAKSFALAADSSRLASLLLSYIPQYAPSSRLAIRAPRPRSSTDLAIRGPLDFEALHADLIQIVHAEPEFAAGLDVARLATGVFE